MILAPLEECLWYKGAKGAPMKFYLNKRANVSCLMC